MTINWGLIGEAPDIGAKFQQGWDRTMAARKQAALEDATRQYAANPTDPNAIGALVAVAPPDLALSLGNQEAARQAAAAKRAQVGAYFKNPDMNAARTQALQSGDLEIADLLDKMSDDHRKQMGEMYKAAGGIAMGAKQLSDPAQRKAYIQTNAPLLKAAGWTDEQISGFDPNDAALDGIIRSATSIESLLPKTVPTVPGGGVSSIDALSGKVSTLVAPNPGNVPMGTPVGDGSPPILTDADIARMEQGGQPSNTAGTFPDPLAPL